jgi:predicted transcriptional regulator
MVKRPKPDKLVAYVRPDLKRKLEKIAAGRGLSVSTLVNLALTEFVKKEGKS